jgi:hypothetical protein
MRKPVNLNNFSQEINNITFVNPMVTVDLSRSRYGNQTKFDHGLKL